MEYRILHVEDSASDAELALRELRRSGLSVKRRLICTEDEFRQSLGDFGPNLILCDHSLPAFNSRAALRILREESRNIPFILLTATLSDEVALELVREGADDYILKDSLVRLPHAVLNVLEKSGIERERKALIDGARTREREAQRKLTDLTRKMILATKAAGLSVWDFYPETGRIDCDDLFYSLYAVRADDFDHSYQSWLHLLHPGDTARTEAEVTSLLVNGGELDIVFRVIHPDGSVRTIRATGVREQDEDGKPARLVGTNQDITDHVQAQRRVQESEVRYRTFFENSLDAILITSPDGRIHAANTAACHIFGKSEEAIIREGRNALIDLEDPRFPALLMQREEMGKARGELTFLRSDGSRFPAEITSAVYSGSDGISYTSMIIRDVTNWKEALSRLRRNERSLREAQKIARIGSWQYDVATDTLEWSAEVYRIMGISISRPPVDFKTFISFVHPEDQAYVLEQIGSTCVSSCKRSFRFRVLAQGKVKYIQERLEAFYDESGVLLRRMGTVQDITENVRAELELKKTNRALQETLTDLNRIMEYSIDVICTSDAEGRFLKVSAAARDMWGYEPQELAGKPYMDLVHPDDVVVTQNLTEPLRNGAVFTNFENRFIRKDGSEVYLTWSARWDEPTQTLHSTAKNITHKKQLEAELAQVQLQAQREITNAHISGQERERAYIGRELHDNINQQLTTAKLYLDLAKDKEGMRGQFISKSEEVIQNVINEIRTLSKSLMTPAQRELSLEEALDELVHTYRLLQPGVFYHFTPHTCMAEFDDKLRLTFYRIVQEQLNNISKYADCSNVWLAFDREGACITLQIRDDGNGFDLSKKRSGIGLANIKGRLELHGGVMEIESAPGKGCCLHIRVPRELSTHAS